MTTHTFRGKRFDDHGLDIDVLPDLIAYKNILVETAKEIWRQKHPERDRLPRGFEESLAIKFYELGEGSTAVPLYREIELPPDLLPLEAQPDELDEAVLLVAKAVDAVTQDNALPSFFPKKVLPFFASYGNTLREDESFEILPELRDRPAIYTQQTRERFREWAPQEYEDALNIIGEVRSADLDGLNFSIRTADGTKVGGKFLPAHEAYITEALSKHEVVQLHVSGTGIYATSTGTLKRITNVTSVVVHDPSSPLVLNPAMPIWQIAAEISQTVPPEEWDKVPRDGSKRIDSYLYGSGEDDS